MKSDLQLQKDVMAELSWEPTVDSTQIGIAVKDGIVTLAGNVDRFYKKWDAETAARRVVGVKALAVEMEVDLPGPSHRTDEEIVRSVENVLSWMTCLPSNAVSTLCENGWITLFGEVPWEYQREAVHTAVRYLLGVTGVRNQIMIKPTLSLKLEKAEIEIALNRQARIDAACMVVEVHGSTVTLSGSVQSVSERDLAKQLVWRSPGVHKVIDHLTVS